MFAKRKWFRRGEVESAAGFSVSAGRDTLIYRESGRRMAINVDVDAGQANIFTDTIGRWDDDPMNAADNATKKRIADNIKQALESQGLLVKLY